jgi:hypothetical protein
MSINDKAFQRRNGFTSGYYVHIVQLVKLT